MKKIMTIMLALLIGAQANAKLMVKVKVMLPDNEAKNYELWENIDGTPAEIPVPDPKTFCAVFFNTKGTKFADLGCGIAGTGVIFTTRVLCGPRDPAGFLSLDSQDSKTKAFRSTRVSYSCDDIKH